jgi:hypothetical protein
VSGTTLLSPISQVLTLHSLGVGCGSDEGVALKTRSPRTTLLLIRRPRPSRLQGEISAGFFGPVATSTFRPLWELRPHLFPL